MKNRKLIEKIQKDVNDTYGRFRSIMPRALSNVIENQIKADIELQKCSKEQIQKVRSYMEQNLTDILFLTAVDKTAKVKEDAKDIYKICEYELIKQEIKEIEEDKDGYEYEGL